MGYSGDTSQQTDPKVLYLISLFGNTIEGVDEEGKPVMIDRFIKEMPLLCLIYEAIVREILDYDYAPKSITITNFRRFANVSQEGVDDINDLRELDLIEKIQLTTKHYTIINGYRITEKGRKVLPNIEPHEKAAIDKMCHCEVCGSLMDLKMVLNEKKNLSYAEDEEAIFEEDEIEFWMVCGEDMKHPQYQSSFLDVEDVSYICYPFFLRDID